MVCDVYHDRSKARKAPRQGAREPTAAELSMEGEEFEEDSILWKIMEVKWDEENMTMVVLYYDVQAVEDHGLNECDLDEDTEEGIQHREQYVEWSTLREVKGWLKTSQNRRK